VEIHGIGCRGLSTTRGALRAGLNRNDSSLILEGAIPAVLLALVVQGLFELAERFLAPKGLRLQPSI
jgi:ABC-type proline/glycine betaine transport system permease subunit